MLTKRKVYEGFTQRFGNLPEEVKRASSSGPIWVHAVSVGEVFAAKDFVKDLSKKYPERKIIFSTTTKTGNAIAKKVLGEDIPKFYLKLLRFQINLFC